MAGRARGGIINYDARCIGRTVYSICCRSLRLILNRRAITAGRVITVIRRRTISRRRISQKIAREIPYKYRILSERRACAWPRQRELLGTFHDGVSPRSVSTIIGQMTVISDSVTIDRPFPRTVVIAREIKRRLPNLANRGKYSVPRWEKGRPARLKRKKKEESGTVFSFY